jgi:hypothetical protein
MAHNRSSNTHRAHEKLSADSESAYFDLKPNSTTTAYDLILKSEALAIEMATENPKFDHLIKFDKHYPFIPIKRADWIEYELDLDEYQSPAYRRKIDLLNDENQRKYTVSADFQDKQYLKYRENYSKVWSFLSGKVSYSIMRVLKTMPEYVKAKGEDEDPLVLWLCIKNVMNGAQGIPEDASLISREMNDRMKLLESTSAFHRIRQGKY